MWDENRLAMAERRPTDLKPAPRAELAAPRPALKEINQRRDRTPKEMNQSQDRAPKEMNQSQDRAPKEVSQSQDGKPGAPSRFDAVRALDEDENWRERTEVITKHDHNLNKELARDIVEQIADSAASTPTESSSSLSFATVSSNPPLLPVSGSLPDVVRVTADPLASDSGDSEYESASEQEDLPEASSAVRSDTSLLADQLLGLALQTPLKARPPPAPQPDVQPTYQPAELTAPGQVSPPALFAASESLPQTADQEPAQRREQQQEQQQETLNERSQQDYQQEQLLQEQPPQEQIPQEQPPQEQTPRSQSPLEQPEELSQWAGGQELPPQWQYRSVTAAESPSYVGLTDVSASVLVDSACDLTRASEDTPAEPAPAAAAPTVTGEAEPAEPAGGGPQSAPDEPAAPVPETAVAPAVGDAGPERGAADGGAVPVSAGVGEPDCAEPPVAEAGCVGESASPPIRAASPPIRAASPPIRAASPPIRAASPPIRAASPPIRAASPPIRAASPPIRAASPPIRAASPPIRAASPPIRAASPPIRAASPPIRSSSPPIRAASPPIRAASPPIRAASPPIRSSSPPIRAASPPIRASSPPIRAASPPIRSSSPPIGAASPPIRAASPPIRSGSPPIRPAGAEMTQTGEDDEPIPPKVGYNLDFLDDPNFNPFSTGAAIKLSPPSSPKVGLPPLKAAKTKKQREAAPPAAPAAPADTNGVNGSDVAATQPDEQPAGQPQAKKPVKKPVRPVKRPLKKKPPPPEPAPEPEPEPAENGRSDSPPLAPPPAKGYNLDFLDDCDDPNFNPFATKTAVPNSPTGSPKAGRKVANSPPPLKAAAKNKSAAKPAAKPAPAPVAAPKSEPEPEPEPEPVVKQEPEPVVKQEPEPVVKQEPEPVVKPEPEEPRPEPAGAEVADPMGGGDAAVPTRADAKQTALLDTAPLDFGEVVGATAADQEMAFATNDVFVEASEFFQDAAALDRLAEHGDGRLAPNIARNSLFVKFDPLLGRPSVLPELLRLAGTQDPPAVPRQLTAVKSDLIAFSPGKEAAEPSPPAAQQVPAAAVRAEPTQPPAAAPAGSDSGVFSLHDAQALKQQELHFQDKLLKRDREMTAMKNSMAKLKQQAAGRQAALEKNDKALEEMVGLVAQMATEKEHHATQLGVALQRLTLERDEARQEVANIEAMFADLHRKYEKSKSVVQENRRCGEKNDSACGDSLEQVSREKQRYDMLQQYAEDQLGRLRTDLEAADKSHGTELLTLKAKLQLSENRATKLERENKEITTICDELIQKMGGAR